MLDEVLKNVVLIAILTIVPIVIKALLKLVEEKTKKIKSQEVKDAIEKTKEIILQCIDETNQVYVKSLKDSKGFNLDEKEDAFNQTKARVLEILNKETKDILDKEYDNANAFINSAIEAKIYNKDKNEE